MRAAVRFAALALVALTAATLQAAATSLATTWLCFFDASSAELSPRSQNQILEMLDFWNRRRRGEVRLWPGEPPIVAYTMPIEVRGHADAAEAAAGKAESVSKARAEAVAAFLRLNGVPADIIKVTTFGAERPLVLATHAEPQNRRAEIIAK